MKSFYIRMVLITFMVMIISSLLAFTVSNVYYQFFLKPSNDEQITETAEEIQHYMENEEGDIHDYLSHIGSLGYQIVLIDNNGNTSQYGRSFREDTLPREEVENVLAGEQYHGVAEQPAGLFVTGFFNNVLENTIGVPVDTEAGTGALFVRPDHEQNLGEFRFFLAVLTILIVLFSFLFVALSARRIVKPIVSLTRATNKIASGSFDIELNVRRKDEIGQLAKHFTSMSNELGQLDAMRQEFVSNVSHEIQTPLTTIRGISQTLQQSDVDKEKQDEYLQMIEKESGRLSLLSQQLLTLSSLDNEEKIVKEQSVDIHKQIRGIIQSLAYQREEKELYIELDGKSEEVPGDENLLYQVWLNVIQNAIKYSEAGGEILIHIKKEEGAVTVSIKDNGIGMEARQAEKIFERFYQGDEARTPGKGGTGLGLAIVQKIVHLHGGTIDVNSSPQAGTVVTIQLVP